MSVSPTRYSSRGSRKRGRTVAAMAVVVEGMKHLVEVLVWLGVHAPEREATSKVEDVGSLVRWRPLNATTEIKTTR